MGQTLLPIQVKFLIQSDWVQLYKNIYLIHMYNQFSWRKGWSLYIASFVITQVYYFFKTSYT